VPPECDAGHVYHLFVVRVRGSQPPHDARAALQASLGARGVETLIHYPVPIPAQPALSGTDPAFCPEAARACGEVLSLPLHHGLADEDVDAVCAAVQSESASLARSI
jgi:dTDP-4-amino-4,6-dideoxygalactose transaminase